MTGRRVLGFDWHLWAPGDYGFSAEDECWIVITPNNHAGNLNRHKVTEHEDGTITVEPSILVSSSRRNAATGKMEPYEVWHGYLERGVWRAC